MARSLRRRWVDALVRLYSEGRWEFADEERRDGYSVVLFCPHGPRYRHPPAALVETVRQLPGVSSVQITFFEDKEPARHAMPPGGFRLAIVNAGACRPVSPAAKSYARIFWRRRRSAARRRALLFLGDGRHEQHRRDRAFVLHPMGGVLARRE